MGHPIENIAPPPPPGALPPPAPPAVPGFSANFHPASLGKTRTPQLGAEVWGPAQFPKSNGMKNIRNKHTHTHSPQKPPPGGCCPRPAHPLFPNFLPAPRSAKPAPNGSFRANRQSPTGPRRPGGLRGNREGGAERGGGGVPQFHTHTPGLQNRSPVGAGHTHGHYLSGSGVTPRSPAAAPNFSTPPPTTHTHTPHHTHTPPTGFPPTHTHLRPRTTPAEPA